MSERQELTPMRERWLSLCTIQLVALLLGVGLAAPAAASPGRLISATRIAGPAHALAWKVFYQTTALDGSTRPVSGIIVVPDSKAPAGGRNVISWAHPTTGIAERCAPSASRNRFVAIPHLSQLLALGYAVVATDYPGLGTPGVHPYLVGVSEARAVIDIVRAARSIPRAHVSKRYVAWGHSQGAQAALFVGQIAPQYAPELTLEGVAAIAPPTDLEENLHNIIATVPGRLLAAYTIVAWANVYAAPISEAVRARSMPIVRLVAHQCAATRFQGSVAMLTARLLSRTMILPQFWTSAAWVKAAHANSADPARASAPLFVAQGTKDLVVTPSITAAFVREACAAGKRVDLLHIEGGGHFWAGFDSADAATSWFGQRFSPGAERAARCTQRSIPEPPTPTI